MDFVTLSSGAILGKKIVLGLTAGAGRNADSHELVLKLKKGKGKLTSTALGLKKSKVELRPAGADNPLQQLWFGTLATGRFGAPRAAEDAVR